MTFDSRERSVFEGEPYELYLFEMGTSAWPQSSGDETVTYDGRTYVPETISRGEIDLSGEDEQGELELTVAHTHPIVALFNPMPAQSVLLTIYRAHRGDSETVVYWSGELSSCEIEGSVATLKGVPVSERLRRMIPGTTFQGQCNWALFSPACGLSKTSFVVQADVSNVSGLTILSPSFGDFGDGYFRGGWVETTDGEMAWITGHTGATLTLLGPFQHLRAGDTVRAYPGCDRTLAACSAFGNLSHYCGFPFVPKRNFFRVGMG